MLALGLGAVGAYTSGFSSGSFVIFVAGGILGAVSSFGAKNAVWCHPIRPGQQEAVSGQKKTPLLQSPNFRQQRNLSIR